MLSASNSRMGMMFIFRTGLRWSVRCAASESVGLVWFCHNYHRRRVEARIRVGRHQATSEPDDELTAAKDENKWKNAWTTTQSCHCCFYKDCYCFCYSWWLKGWRMTTESCNIGRRRCNTCSRPHWSCIICLSYGVLCTITSWFQAGLLISVRYAATEFQ